MQTGLRADSYQASFFGERFHIQPQALHAYDFRFIARLERPLTDGLPEFAMDRQLPVGSQAPF